MKQTNNAIKFLLAQYRSVLQHAFIKGLAASLAFTAGFSAVSAQAADDAPLVLDKGIYTAVKDSQKVQKDEVDFTATSTALGKITADSTGTLAIKGQVTLNNATFSVPSDGEGAGYGARVAFDNVSDFDAVNGYSNIINLIGTNTFKDQLTVHSKTQLQNGGSGSLVQYGYLTISQGARDSDFSAVDISINVAENGENEGDGQLIIDPNITVGNLTFGSGTHINLYADNGGSNANTANYGSRTITVADNKKVVFESGSHFIATSMSATHGSNVANNPSLVFSGTNTAQVVNDGSLGIRYGVTFNGGIVFNNNGTVTTVSGSVSGTPVRKGDIIVTDSTLSNNANATLTMGSGTTLSINSGSTFINKGAVVLEAESTSDIDVGSLAVSQKIVDDSDDTTFNIIELDKALGDFASSGTLTLKSAYTGDDIEYGVNTDLNYLKDLGVDFTKTAGKAKLVIDNIALRVDDNLDLSSDKLAANISGSGTYGEAELHSLGTLTYTTSSNDTEDLNGLELVGIEKLQFNSGKDSEKLGTSILVSGSSANTQFGVNKNLASEGNKDLKFQQATLILDNYSLDRDTLIQGTISSNLIMDSGSKLLLNNNAWTAQNITVQSGGTFTLTASESNVGLTAQKITVSDTGSKITVEGGYLTANTFDIGISNGLDVSNKAVITVKGDDSGETVDFKGGTNISLSGSSLDLGDLADTVGMTFTAGNDGQPGTLKTNSGYSQFTANNVELTVNLDNVTGLDSLTMDQANSLLGLLAKGTGLVHLTGDTQPNIETSTVSGEQVVKFEDLASGGSLNMTFDNETTQSSVLTGVTNDVTGGWKAVQTTGSDASVAANGTLSLQGANTGNYAQNADGNIVGVDLKDNSNLNLKATTATDSGKGYIGEISGSETSTLTVAANADVSVVNASNTSQANVNVGTLESNGVLTAKNVTATNLTNAGTLNAAVVTAENASLDQGSSVVADKLVINETGTASGAQLNVKELNISGSATLTGSALTSTTVKASELTLDQNTVAAVSGNVSVGSLTMTGDSQLSANSISLTDKDSVLRVGQDSGETTAGGSAQLSVISLELNGGKLVVDPEFSEQTATVFAQNFDAARKDDTSVTTLNGTIIIGKNSALGLGGTEEAFRNALARYQTNGSLSNDYGAYVYINRANLELGSGKLIIGSEALDQLEGYETSTATIYLGTDSALQVSQKAINEANQNDSTVFTDMSSKTIQSTDGTLIIPANLSATNIATIFGSKVQLNSDDTIKVTTENGLYTGIINSSEDLQGTGDFSLTLSDNSRSILSNLSNPTYDYVINVMSQDSAHYDNAKDFEAALDKDQTQSPAYGTNGVAIVDESEGYQFLQEALGSSNYQSIEQGARLALFGGAVQAVQVASNSTTDAVNSRLGMGNAASRLVAADNAQGAGLWLAPVYRNFSSDSFDGQGVGYGADVDLTGAALGADFTMSNGLRIGGALNVGSGDVDGQGAGAGVSNDFDYFGFTIYAGFSPIQNLTLSADVSYTNVDNDLDANSGVVSYGKLTASTDSTAWSVGIGAQYLMQTASLDVAPHIGLRYTNYDVDDYDLKVDGTTIAQTNGDSASVFSIPFGVSLSKDLAAGEWTVRPAADFTVTLNLGDDDIDSATSFDGVFGDEIKYNTEFMDNVTYGATLGVSAKNGNLSFGLNAGYTGSSNTDEYTVGANARFVF